MLRKLFSNPKKNLRSDPQKVNRLILKVQNGMFPLSLNADYFSEKEILLLKNTEEFLAISISCALKHLMLCGKLTPGAG